MKSTISFKKYLWAAVIVWTMIIFAWSLQSGDDSGRVSGSLTEAVFGFLARAGLEIDYESAHHFIRKTAHFTEYAVLGALVFNAQKKTPLLKSDVLCICLWMISVPAADETIQRFVPERAGMIADVLLDMCGFACAVFLCILLKRKKT